MAFFGERLFIDHQNLRRFGQIIDAPAGIEDTRYLDLQRALPALKGCIPDTDFKYMAHQLVNQRYCAQGIADCLQMYGYMLAQDRGERLPDLSDFETDMKRRLSEWHEHDQENCALMNGPNVIGMLEELRSK